MKNAKKTKKRSTVTKSTDKKSIKSNDIIYKVWDVDVWEDMNSFDNYDFNIKRRGY